MKARTLIDLLALSTNIYMISKDEKFMNNLKEMAEKGREKVVEFASDLKGEDDEKLFDRIVAKANEAREELENKIGEVAEKVYHKMHIAHIKEIEKLENKIAELSRKLALTEARLVAAEAKK